jgi:hypothetical protein
MYLPNFYDIGFTIVVLVTQCDIASIRVGTPEFNINITVIRYCQVPGTTDTICHDYGFKITGQKQAAITRVAGWQTFVAGAIGEKNNNQQANP